LIKVSKENLAVVRCKLYNCPCLHPPVVELSLCGSRGCEGLPVQVRVCVAMAAGLALSACATKSADVAPAYVSPLQYQTFTCPQLAEEAQRVSAAATTASGAQDSQATKDAVATTVAVVVFWPSAFFVQGDKQTAAQLAQLKGQMDAIQQESIRKNCAITFHNAPPPSPATSAQSYAPPRQ
jgi:hypothetical protein